VSKRVDVRNRTDECNRNGPEDDKYGDHSGSGKAANDSLPPLDPQVLPDDFVWSHTGEARGHVEDLVMGQTLVSSLSFGESGEFDKDGADLLGIVRSVLGLEFGDLWNESLELGAAPVDGVDLLANKRLQTVGWTVLFGDPLASYIARLDGGSVRVALRGTLLVVLLFRLETLAVGGANEFGLCTLQLHGSLVALLDKVVQLLGVTGNPNALDSGTEHSANGGLLEVRSWNRCKQDGPG